MVRTTRRPARFGSDERRSDMMEMRIGSDEAEYYRREARTDPLLSVLMMFSRVASVYSAMVVGAGVDAG